MKYMVIEFMGHSYRSPTGPVIKLCSQAIPATSHSAIFEIPVLPMSEDQSLPLTHYTFLGRHHLIFTERTQGKAQYR